MKTTRILSIAAFCAALTFASCTSNKEIDTNGNPEEGLTTYASFNFKVGNSETTRGAMTGDTDEATTTIKNIRLLIFKTGASTVCEVNEVVDATDKSKTVKLTSGKKKIFVIANAEGATKTKALLEGVVENTTTFGQFRDIMTDLGTGDPITAFDISELVGNATNGMIMSNAIDINSEKILAAGITENDSKNVTGTEAEKNAKNNFKITIQRAVAKGMVYYSDAAVLTTKDSKNKGVLSELKFGFRNVNRSFYPFQRFGSELAAVGAEIPRAPYYNWTPADPTDKTQYAKYYYSGNDHDREMKMLTDLTNSTSYYITENTSTSQQVGNSTWALITGTFKPEKSAVVSDFNYNSTNDRFTVTNPSADVPTGTGKKLYLLNVTGEGLTAFFFTDIQKARQVAYCIKHGQDTDFNLSAMPVDYNPNDAAELGANTLLTYNDCKCYYRLNLGVGDTNDNSIVFGVKRNNNYQAKVTKFAQIGTPTIEELENGPDQPLDAKTHVTATIDIAAWNTAGSSTEL